MKTFSRKGGVLGEKEKVCAGFPAFDIYLGDVSMRSHVFQSFLVYFTAIFCSETLSYKRQKRLVTME